MIMVQLLNLVAGFIDHRYKEICPCIFNNFKDMSIGDLSFWATSNYAYEKSSKNLVVFVRDKVSIQEQIENAEIFTSENCVQIYDKDKNLTKIFRYSNGRFNKIDEINDKIEKVIDFEINPTRGISDKPKDYKTYYISSGSTTGRVYDAQTREFLLDGRKEIEYHNVSGGKTFQFKESIDGKDYVGLYYLDTDKIIVDPKDKIIQIDYDINTTTKKEDGSLVFFAEKEVTDGDNTDNYWGITDSSGKIIVDFAYNIIGKNKTQTKVTEKGNSCLTIPVYEMLGTDGKRAFLRVWGDKNLYKEDEVDCYVSSNSDRISNGCVKSDSAYSKAMSDALIIAGIATENVGLMSFGIAQSIYDNERDYD